MWLVIDTENENRVFAIEGSEPSEDSYPPPRFVFKEWDGSIPTLRGPEGPGDVDPTSTDQNYADKVQQRVDFRALGDKAATEIEWLEDTIPTVDGMTLEELRAFLKRLARENLEMIRAWRYVIRRLI